MKADDIKKKLEKIKDYADKGDTYSEERISKMLSDIIAELSEQEAETMKWDCDAEHWKCSICGKLVYLRDGCCPKADLIFVPFPDKEACQTCGGSGVVTIRCKDCKYHENCTDGHKMCPTEPCPDCPYKPEPQKDDDTQADIKLGIEECRTRYIPTKVGSGSAIQESLRRACNIIEQQQKEIESLKAELGVLKMGYKPSTEPQKVDEASDFTAKLKETCLKYRFVDDTFILKMCEKIDNHISEQQKEIEAQHQDFDRMHSRYKEAQKEIARLREALMRIARTSPNDNIYSEEQYPYSIASKALENK